MHELQLFKEINEPVSLMILDIDFFKHVNDTYGHGAGDEVLKDLSDILNTNVRSNDKVARWGGEEFLIMLVGTNLHQAQLLAEKLRKMINGNLFQVPQKITCSFGVATVKEGDTVKSLVERSDNALYRAKDGGRNCVNIID